MNDREAAPILIDGSRGEGGGQVLRTSLTLSLITGRAVRIHEIRVKRRNPGLRRQHLTAVRAAAAVGAADTNGARLGSRSLEFRPRGVRGGDYAFDIGTAGSCTLVLQTLLPALLVAKAAARIRLSGGTHNPHAPPVDFLQRAFLPLLRRMGAEIELKLLRHGFYPGGGGELSVEIAPADRLRQLHLTDRGAFRRARAEVLIASLPSHVAERELDTLRRTLGWDDEQLCRCDLPAERGPGNALVATIEHAHVVEVFTTFGERGVRAETVAGRLCRQVQAYLSGGAAVGPYLADQLLLPLAVAGGVFVTRHPTAHTLTNLETIRSFLGNRFTVEEAANGSIRIAAQPLPVNDEAVREER